MLQILLYFTERIFMNLKKEQSLFFDIETTGFHADVSAITLIGCCDMNGNVTQWFNEDGLSQKKILCEFLDFIKPYDTLISFNGKTFDLPFLVTKIKELKLPASLDSFFHLDLYQTLKPFQHLWNLQKFRQKDLEGYLNIQRMDQLSGKKLVTIYQEYLDTKNEKNKESLLLHNREDLLGLRSIYSLLAYPCLLHKDFSFVSAMIKDDLFIATLGLTMEIPIVCEYEKAGIHLTLNKKEATLTCPIEQGSLKHYHKDYKNYYYLPKEDIVIHKSMKSFVDTKSLVRASMDTCYSKFIPSQTFLTNKEDLLSFCSDTISYVLCKK